MILTDDEIKVAVGGMGMERADVIDYITFGDLMNDYRAIESAILEKLEGSLKPDLDAAYERAAALIDNRHWSVDSGKRFAMAIRELKGTGAQLSGNTEQLIKVLDDVRQTLRYIPEDRVADACEINAAIVKINEVLK